MEYSTKPVHERLKDSPLLGTYDVFNYRDKFKDYTCFLPFKRIELHDDGRVTVCCLNWASYSIGNWKIQSLKEIWSGVRANIFRKSVANDRDYKFCNCTACPRLQDPDKLLTLSPIQRSVIEAWNQSNTLPVIGEVHISIDRSCQLECPSCRPGFIFSKNIFEERPALLHLANGIIDMYNKGEIMRISASGAGDPFISPFCQKIMNEVVGTEQSTFRIATNGLGFTELWYSRHPNMHKLLDEIEVSVDAGSEETYKIVRKGGNWKTLLKNLEFISTLNRPTFINIVVQKINYREIAQMFELCKKYKFTLSLKKILPWSQAGMKDFDDMAIWQKEHPDHSDFIEVLKGLDFNSPYIRTHDLTDYIRELKLIS